MKVLNVLLLAASAMMLLVGCNSGYETSADLVAQAVQETVAAIPTATSVIVEATVIVEVTVPGEAAAPAAPAPQPTATPLPPTPTPAPEPQAPAPEPAAKAFAVVRQGATLHSGPNPAFPEVGQVAAGDGFDIVGRNDDGTWWLVRRGGEAAAWIAADAVTPLGEFEAVGALDDVPDSPPEPTPTATPPLAYLGVSQAVNLRSGPGATYRWLGQAQPGDAYRVLGRNGDDGWWQIELADGEMAWVAADYVNPLGMADQVPVVADMPPPPPAANPGPTPPPEPLYAYVAVPQRVNLRSGPGTTFDQVAQAEAGDAFAVTGIDADGGWWQVQMEAGGTAWVYAGAVDPLGMTDQVPVVEATAGALPYEGPGVLPTPAAPLLHAYAVIREDVVLRSAPGSAFEEVGRAEAGQSFRVVGRSQDGQWVQVQPKAGGQAWVAVEFARLLGQIAQVPVIGQSGAPVAAGRAASATLPSGSAQTLVPTGVSVACPTSSTNQYTLIPNPGPPAARPDNVNADLIVKLRGYEASSLNPDLIDLAGGTDPNAPLLAGIFASDGVPTFTAAYQVRDWDWNCGEHGCAADFIGDPEITMLGMAVVPGEPLQIPSRDPEIYGGGYKAIVMYASEDALTLTYARDDSVAVGYTVHMEGLCVDPNLVAAYRAANAAGRPELPALRNEDILGTAAGRELLVAVRDRGRFLDPRSRKDWWRGAQPRPVSFACREENSLPPTIPLAPPSDLSCNGPVRFTWEWSETLQGGEVYEIHIWPDNKQNRDRVAQSSQTSAVVDLRQVGTIDPDVRPYWWEVIVVCASDGHWISRAPEPRLFYYEPRITPVEANPDVNCE